MNTPIWQLVILPADPVYWRATPQEARPCLRKPVSSTTRTASRGQGLNHVVAHHVAKRIGVPLRPPEQRLLAPGAGITRGFRSHPTRLAPLRPEQRIQKEPGRGCHSVLLEQRPHPPLHIP